MNWKAFNGVLILTLLLSVSACDNFSLYDNFTNQFGLTLTLQKEEVNQGETIELHPSGGVAPYDFAVLADNLYYQGTLGTISNNEFTAGTSIGKVTIWLADSGGNSVNRPVIIRPPALESFTVNGATGTNQIDLSWTYSDTSMISGFRILRSVDGESLSIYTELGSEETTFTDTGLNNTKQYTYRMYAVSGEYLSLPTAELSAHPNS